MIGVMNWIMPISDRSTRRVPAANSSSGTAVAMPAQDSSTVCSGLTVPIVMPWPSCATTMRMTAAIGIIQNDSSVRPLTASTEGPIFFLTSPYSPKDAVSDSAIHGKAP